MAEPVIIYWEGEPGRTRIVRSICAPCQKFMVREFGMRLRIEEPGIVSPRGVMHAQGEYPNEDRTACGKDATGEDWWWRL